MNPILRRLPAGGSERDLAPRAQLVAAGLLTAACAAAVCGASPAAAAPVRAPASSGGQTPVVVVAADGEMASAVRSVHRLHGTVGHRLPLIGGFAARVPARSLDALRGAQSVRSVTSDRRFSVRGEEAPAVAGTTLAQLREVIGAARLAPAATNAPRVGVALVDTGVTPVAALSAPGTIVNAPDFSSDAGSPELRNLDALGHGTHLAGIIGGADGVAPTARLVNVKVAAADGSTSLSELLAGIDWTVRSRNQAGLNIRVIELAFGADADGSYRDDPLAMAVERAWQHDIVVVSAAGNGGNDSGGLDSLAVDPFLVAVGASDTNGTVEPGDDAVAAFSSGGTAQRGPDVVAPGAGIVSSRVPGGLLDAQFPGARVGEDGFRGSGTSQASAAVAGAAALILERRGGLEPDEVKAVLTRAARPLAGAAADLQGRGSIDVAGSISASAGGARQSWPRATRAGRVHAMVPRVELAVEDLSSSRWGSSRWGSSRWGSSRWGSSRWGSSRWGSSRWGSSRWGSADWGSGTP